MALIYKHRRHSEGRTAQIAEKSRDKYKYIGKNTSSLKKGEELTEMGKDGARIILRDKDGKMWWLSQHEIKKII